MKIWCRIPSPDYVFVISLTFFSLFSLSNREPKNNIPLSKLSKHLFIPSVISFTLAQKRLTLAQGRYLSWVNLIAALWRPTLAQGRWINLLQRRGAWSQRKCACCSASFVLKMISSANALRFLGLILAIIMLYKLILT